MTDIDQGILNEKIQKLYFVHEKAFAYFTSQQKAIDLLTTKANWIVIANVALIGLIFNSANDSFSQVVGLIFAVISLIIALTSIWTKKYKFGPKIQEMIDKSPEISLEEVLTGTNQKYADHISYNRGVQSQLVGRLKKSIVFLVAGIIILSIPYLFSIIIIISLCL